MNRKLALINRAKMITLNAIRRFGDTDAEDSFRQALTWLVRATTYVRDGMGGEDACLVNAVTHLQTAARALGHSPIDITFGAVL